MKLKKLEKSSFFYLKRCAVRAHNATWESKRQAIETAYN